MNMINKKVKMMLIAVMAVIAFSSTGSHAQLSLFNVNTNTDDAFRINTGAPYVVNGRTYYYSQTPVIVGHEYNDRRFCPPGQYKKGRCMDWRYYEEHRKRYERNHHDNWNNGHNDEHGHGNSWHH